MDMHLNAALIRSERLKRAWSQEHLAQVSGLGLRTVQRIEAGTPASLETVKSLAAVLELSIDTLLLVPETPASSTPFWRHPIKRIVTACSATLALVTMATVFVPGVMAQQVELNMAVQRNEETISQHHLVSEDGQVAEVLIEQLLKITLSASIHENATVMIQTEIFTWQDGDYHLVGKPGLLAADGKPVQLRVTTDAGDRLNFSLKPQIQ